MSEIDINKLAKLARINLSKEEKLKFQSEVPEIMKMVAMLQEVDVTELKETTQISGLQNVMRPDVVKPSVLTHEQLLANAPETQDGYIKVPRVRE